MHLRANHEQNVADAISILPQLLIGLDVNLKFRTITDFEFTSQCVIFDLLEINLVHGWLMDPKDGSVSSLFGGKLSTFSLDVTSWKPFL